MESGEERPVKGWAGICSGGGGRGLRGTTGRRAQEESRTGKKGRIPQPHPGPGHLTPHSWPAGGWGRDGGSDPGLAVSVASGRGVCQDRARKVSSVHFALFGCPATKWTYCLDYNRHQQVSMGVVEEREVGFYFPFKLT